MGKMLKSKIKASCFMLGASVVALLSASAFAGGASAQQSGASTENVEEVTVTGTSIRGVQPVGSNIIATTRLDLDKTNVQSMQQIYKTIPALSNMGALPQGNQSGNAYYSPTIHNLGSSSSNSTLVLIDGHRFSLGSQQQPLSDPGIIPAIAVERVEVLADGASATYGSDAVAGVVNFVTRKDFEGLEIDGQAGFADGYSTLNSSILWGERWSDASLMLAASYSYRSVLRSDARDFLNPNHIAQGGTNFDTYNCDPAVLQPAGQSNLYLSAAATTSVPNNAAMATCNTNAYSALAPSDLRMNGMMKFTKNVGKDLTIGVDAVYSDRIDKRPLARGTLTATAFGTGAQANPFYTNPAGFAGPATSQTVRWDADQLLGPGALGIDDAKDMYVDSTLDYRINEDWHATLLVLYGSEDNTVASYGTLCGSCANLALNGTTNSSGSLTTPSVPGTSQLVLGYPLTAANALDVWNPAGTNRTSAAVKAALTDSGQTSVWNYATEQYRGGVDGKLFTLPGGDVHVALGTEFVHYTLDINKTSPNNTGPATTGSAYLHIPLKRSVTSAYGEILVPIVSPEMKIPFVNKLTVDVSGRYDNYDDVGDTTNPKIAADWEVVEGFKIRGNWASSFVAPELSSVGDLTHGGQTSFTSYAVSATNFTVNTLAFPSAIGLPNCSVAQAAAANNTCAITSSTQGVSFNGSPANPKPSLGRSWSIGFDLSPAIVPGLTIGVTLFNTAYINAITGTSLSNALNTPSLGLINFFPSGATLAQINALLPPYATASAPRPQTTYYVLSTRQNNVLNLDIQGIDASIGYNYATDNLGDFDVGLDMSEFTMFKQHLKGGTQFNVLGSTGYNNTFGSVPIQARAHLGWTFAAMQAELFANYVSGYHNWSGNTVAPVTLVNTLPAGGGDTVKSNTTFDLNLSYTLSESDALGKYLNGSQVFVDIQNLFDKAPVFYNGATGYDGYTGNPIGRLVTFGMRTKF
jgi:iron complex outermembrane receptor protein